LTERRVAPAADPEFEKLLAAVWCRIDREDLAHLVQELVRIPSVYRPEEAGGSEERVASFVADYLERAGFGVVTARDGAEALAKARASMPDLIVLDLALPKMDGLDVT